MLKNVLHTAFRQRQLPTPQYVAEKTGGPDHCPHWSAVCHICDGSSFQGDISVSRKKAESNAAGYAMQYLESQGLDMSRVTVDPKRSTSRHGKLSTSGRERFQFPVSARERTAEIEGSKPTADTRGVSKSDKNLLQTYVQTHGHPRPVYASKRVGGEDHNPMWRSQVTLWDGTTVEGRTEASRKRAELDVASEALRVLAARTGKSTDEFVGELTAPADRQRKAAERQAEMATATGVEFLLMDEPTDADLADWEEENARLVFDDETVAVLVDTVNQSDSVHTILSMIRSKAIKVMVFSAPDSDAGDGNGRDSSRGGGGAAHVTVRDFDAPSSQQAAAAVLYSDDIAANAGTTIGKRNSTGNLLAQQSPRAMYVPPPVGIAPPPGLASAFAPSSSSSSRGGAAAPPAASQETQQFVAGSPRSGLAQFTTASPRRQAAVDAVRKSFSPRRQGGGDVRDLWAAADGASVAVVAGGSKSLNQSPRVAAAAAAGISPRLIASPRHMLGASPVTTLPTWSVPVRFALVLHVGALLAEGTYDVLLVVTDEASAPALALCIENMRFMHGWMYNCQLVGETMIKVTITLSSQLDTVVATGSAPVAAIGSEFIGQ